MRTGSGLLVGWLLAAVVLLAVDGRLLMLILVAVPGSLLVLGVRALVRQQLAPSPYNGPPLPERYRVADDLRRPLADVVAAAEADASDLARGDRRGDGLRPGARRPGRDHLAG